MMTTPRMIEASSHRFIISLMKPAASSTKTSTLLNCCRKRMNGPRLRAVGSMFGPYSAWRRVASASSRPVVTLVLSRWMASSAVSACQAVCSASLIAPAPYAPRRGGAREPAHEGDRVDSRDRLARSDFPGRDHVERGGAMRGSKVGQSLRGVLEIL